MNVDNEKGILGEELDTTKMPGHWLLARLGKRVLRPGGRELTRQMLNGLSIKSSDDDEDIKQEIQKALIDAIHVGARPLTVPEWRTLLESEGFIVHTEATTPMHLLEPNRLIQDEGFLGTLRFVWNVLRDDEARHRVATMRKVFQTYEENLASEILRIAFPSETNRPIQFDKPNPLTIGRKS